MTVTLHLPPEKEAAFKARRPAKGLSVEGWLLEIAEQNVPQPFDRPPPKDRSRGMGKAISCLG